MSLRGALAYIVPSLRPKQRCEACGQEFHCGASLAGCWCAEIELSEAVRAELRAKYRGCLCRACLEKTQAANRKPTAGA